MLRAVLFIPSGPGFDRWRDICAQYATDHRYLIVAIATSWVDVMALLIAGKAAIAIIGDRAHLPADRTPRVEVVTEAPAHPPEPERRAQRVRA